MDFVESSRQKKHKSAFQKTQHKRISKRISKRTIDFSKQKGIMKQARRQEQFQKHVGWSERTFFCNVCKSTYINSVCRCNYVDWCGAKSKSYKNCLYGIDICEYHNGDFNNVATSREKESKKIRLENAPYDRYQEIIDNIMLNTLMSSIRF
jgi:hypothetical protein